MKKQRLLRFFAYILIATALPILLSEEGSAQFDRYLVLYPSYIDSGAYAGDYDLFAAGFSEDGRLRWESSKPKPISTGSYRELSVTTATDGRKGIFIAYTVEHTDSANRGDRDILLRRLDADGNDVWNDSLGNSVVVAQSRYVEQNPRIVILDDTSLMVFYEVHYAPGNSDGDVDVAAVRFSYDGKMLWENGLWLANSEKQERVATAVNDGLGSGIAVIETAVPGDSLTAVNDIIAVRVDGNGVLGWSGISEPIPVAVSRHREQNAAAIPDGEGGLYIAYQLEYVTGPRAGDIDIFAQHVSRYGIRMWVDEATPPVVSSITRAAEYEPALALDSGDLVVAFRVFFNDASYPLHLVGVQRMNHLGQAVWNEGKKATLLAIKDRIAGRPQLLANERGGVFMVIEGSDPGRRNGNIYAQHIARDGTMQWGDRTHPMPVIDSPHNERDPAAHIDGHGGLIVVATRDLVVNEHRTDSTMVAQRITGSGGFPWKEIYAPIVISRTGMKDGSPCIVKTR